MWGHESIVEKPLQISYLNDFVFPLHLHQEVEIICASEGKIALRIDEKDCMLSPGEIAVIFPNVMHGYIEKECVHGKGVFFLCPPEISGDFVSLLLTKKPINPILEMKNLNPDLLTVMHLIVEENENNADIAVLRAYMQVILARLIPALELRDAKEETKQSTLYRLLSYLALHCTEKLTLEELSERFSLSISYISHIFSDVVGINFRSYINALRLLRATRMLKCTDKPVTRICYECGFESQRTFNRAFREHYGVTPTEYRADWGHEAP